MYHPTSPEGLCGVSRVALAKWAGLRPFDSLCSLMASQIISRLWDSVESKAGLNRRLGDEGGGGFEGGTRNCGALLEKLSRRLVTDSCRVYHSTSYLLRKWGAHGLRSFGSFNFPICLTNRVLMVFGHSTTLFSYLLYRRSVLMIYDYPTSPKRAMRGLPRRI